jgi:D-alanyl-D-alanine carboxypeptidase
MKGKTFPLHLSTSLQCPLCQEKLKEAHEKLQVWFGDLKKEFNQVHVSWAWRGKEDQERFFKEKKTRAHFPYSKHNHMKEGKPCSLALDLFELVNARAVFNPKFYLRIHKFNQAKNHEIKWGGLFKNFKDYPHFELIT